MRILLFLLTFLIFTPTNAEKLPPIIKRLALHPGHVITFSPEKKALFPIVDLSPEFLNQYQSIVKNKNGLFLSISGSARIYKLNIVGDSLKLQRIDRTIYGGYNYGCLNFSLDTVLYSYGGYGIWNYSGHLRYYMPKFGEWNIRPTNTYIHREFEFQKPENFYYLDTAKRALYISGAKYEKDHIRNFEKKHGPFYGKLYRLDIDSANWTEIGYINDTWSVYQAQTPFGLLAQPGGYLIDIRSNRVSKLTGITAQNVLNTPASSSYKEVMLSYCIDSTVYFGDMENWIDSVIIDPKDIIDTGKPVYTTPVPTNTYFAGGIALLLTVAGILFVQKRMKNKNVPAEDTLTDDPSVQET